nr:wnt inhibitory factor 1-like [Crassostrea gigas]
MTSVIFSRLLFLLSICVLPSFEYTCTLNSCKNGGSCLEGKCVCPEGYFGENCEDECDGPDTCYNHGACLGTPRKCICDVGYQLTGYYGNHCEDSCDPNLNGTCGFAGTCSGIPKRCICKPDFYGTWCSACMDNSHCKNGGLCDIDGNCKCRKFDPEITGVHCEEVCNKDSDCMNLGMCLPNKTCKCKVHFDDGFRCISSDAVILKMGWRVFFCIMFAIKTFKYLLCLVLNF